MQAITVHLQHHPVATHKLQR